MLERLAIIAFISVFHIKDSSSQEIYVGKKLGEFSSYHHQVSGEVFAVDEATFLIKKFTYDGNGKDTFFWAGSRPRPGPQGFLVPNELGRTNLLESYLNNDITIRLPDGKQITDIKWLSVYDLSRLEAFGDIYIPADFEPPQKVVLPRFKSRTERVSSNDIIVVDSKTLQIHDFYYDGRGETYFWVGLGPQPHSKGKKIPDEHGYMTPLRAYDGQDLNMTLPGEMDVFTTDWLALFDMSTKEVLGHVIIPDDLNVPPSLVTITAKETKMPNCEQIHKNIQLGWEIFGDVITVEMAVNMGQDDYVAFGISGSDSVPQMQDGDAAVLFRDTYNGYIKDYSMTAYFPCTELIRGQRKGVCEDLDIKGQDNLQLLSSTREEGISTFTFRRPLKSPDEGDKPYPKGRAQIIWAMGPLDHLDTRPRPSMHLAWSKIAQPLDFGRTPAKNCFAFTHENNDPIPAWRPVHLTHPSKNLTFHLGPDGGPRGYSGITKSNSATGLAWYVDGFLVPEIYLRRDEIYEFYVYGGTNVYDPTNYHPLIITDESRGGFSQLKEAKKKKVRIFAGVETSVRGDLRPLRGGDLCKWEHPKNLDRRRDVDLTTYVDFRNSLSFSCDPAEKTPGILRLMPNRSWPDVVYYNSWTGENMGWKLHIRDPERGVILS